MKKLSLVVSVLLVALLLAAGAASVAFASPAGQGITGDKVVLGDNYVLDEGQTLDGNLVVMGGSAQVHDGATVDGDLTVMGGSLILNGAVTGNLAILGGSAVLGNSAVIEGDLSVLAGSIDRAPGAVVQGDTFNGFRTPAVINPAPVVPNFDAQGETPRSWFGRFVGWQFGTLGTILLMGLLGLVLVVVAPRAVGRVASATAVQPALTFVFGLLTLVLGLLAGAILLLACGLGLLVWGALVAAWVLGWIGVALWLGQRLLRALKARGASAIGEVLVGVVIITFLSRLPCIGWLFWLVFASWGLGAVVMTRFGTRDADAPSGGSPAAATGGPYATLPETSTTVAPSEPARNVDLGAAAEFTRINGIDVTLAGRLREAGIRTLADLANSHPVELATATGVPVGQIVTEDWIGQAQRLL